jgi:ketoreductase
VVENRPGGGSPDRRRVALVTGVLVSNAGMGIHGEIGGCETKLLDLQLALNLRAVMLFYREALGLLRAAAREHRDAVVIDMSSVLGKQGAAGLSVYSAAKRGVVGFTEATNAELSGAPGREAVLTG